MNYDSAILWPVFAQVLLIYFMYYLVGKKRFEAMKAGDARLSQFRENRNEPERSVLASNNLLNQFQLPMLFIAVCFGLSFTGGSSVPAVSLAWLFVATRLLHAVLHVRSPRTLHRSWAFLSGYVVNALLWILFAWSLLTA